jgi:hypothetical protein
MRHLHRGISVFVALLAVTSCERSPAPADSKVASNTSAICKQYLAVVEDHNGNSAESKAYNKAVEEAYKGQGDLRSHRIAETTYYAAWVRDLRPLADKAIDTDLKSALADNVKYFEQRSKGTKPASGSGQGALQRISAICQPPSNSPSN